VVVWAAIGALLLAVVVYGWGRWILAGDFQHAPYGPDQISEGKEIGLRIYEFVSAALALWMIVRYLVKPLIRERRLTLDGMIIIGAVLTLFWDPLINATNFTFAYNAHHLFAFESWLKYMPGVSYATVARFPESPLFMGAYIWWIMASAIAGCAILRQLKARRPHWGLFRGYAVIFVLVTFLDLVIENGLIIRVLGAWNYVGVVEDLTLWPGSRYQMPIYICLLSGAWAVLLTAIRYQRDDQGLSIVERGANQLRVSSRGRTLVRFLAVTGAVQLSVIVLYIPWQIISLNADTSPKDAPSYMLDGMCGKGTDYACPNDEVPIPVGGSLHISPDDERLPEDIRVSENGARSENSR
jgi:hypothetical protein